MKGIGLPVLCCLLLLLLIIGPYSYSEGFADKKVPSFCGTYGYTEKDIINPKNLQPTRKYTQSDCDALGGVLRGTECFELKKKKKKKGEEEEELEENAPIDPDMIKKNYSNACAGLNAQDTPQPSECGGLGTLNKAFTMTIEGKTIKVKPDLVRLYSQDECDSLEGNFTSLKALAKQLNTPITDLKKASGGDKEAGFCQSGSFNFSNACTGNPSLLSGGGTGSLFSSFWTQLTNLF